MRQGKERDAADGASPPFRSRIARDYVTRANSIVKDTAIRPQIDRRIVHYQSACESVARYISATHFARVVSSSLCRTMQLVRVHDTRLNSVRQQTETQSRRFDETKVYGVGTQRDTTRRRCVTLDSFYNSARVQRILPASRLAPPPPSSSTLSQRAFNNLPRNRSRSAAARTQGLDHLVLLRARARDRIRFVGNKTNCETHETVISISYVTDFASFPPF